MTSPSNDRIFTDKLKRQVVSVPVVRVSPPSEDVGKGGGETGHEGGREDVVVAEAPLQVQVQGRNLAVLMRTPGDDEVLTLGFLFTEGIISSAHDVRSIRHCDAAGDDEPADWDDDDHVMQVLLHDDTALQARARRATLSSSSCGMCGTTLLDELALRCAPVPPLTTTIPIHWLTNATRAMQSAQPVHRQTGACHAAAAFVVGDAGLQLAALFEDVGRHNACDKLLGHALHQAANASTKSAVSSTKVWVLSSRIAYELVHKAALAQVSVLAGVSAPTSLAIRLAERMGITLVGFVRGQRANVYTHAQQLEFPSLSRRGENESD